MPRFISERTRIVRLFVALLLGECVRAGLARVQAKLARSCEKVRWIPSEQLHLTVKFLGEVAESDVTAVSEALARASLRAAPCTMEIACTGCFPSSGPVRIVWAGARDTPKALDQCVETVTSELAQIGFAPERRPWSAHITLGRVRDDRTGGRIRAAVDALSLEAMEQPVEAVTLMSSVLSAKGPTYAVVSSASLGSGDSRARDRD